MTTLRMCVVFPVCRAIFGFPGKKRVRIVHTLLKLRPTFYLRGVFHARDAHPVAAHRACGTGSGTGFRPARVAAPGLPEQPIFSPVLNENYVTRIAREWNLAPRR